MKTIIFFITGHSLGGAVANCLSVDSEIMEFVSNNKSKIYTYTFESPHTCVNLWWLDPITLSNAYNLKDNDDGVTKLAPYPGATTYGLDLSFTVGELDNKIFLELFPNAKGGNVVESTKVINYGSIFGHHDVGLDLVYILQTAENNGWWDSWKNAAKPLSRSGGRGR